MVKFARVNPEASPPISPYRPPIFRPLGWMRVEAIYELISSFSALPGVK